VTDASLDCSGLTELVTDYLEHALDPRRALSFETHTVFCPGCRVLLGQTRDIIERLKAVPPEPTFAGQRDAVLAAYRERA
jgi:putative zinc finger protein